ncbi:hypothetical protein VPH35_014275 [Triticum aestivum]
MGGAPWTRQRATDLMAYLWSASSIVVSTCASEHVLLDGIGCDEASMYPDLAVAGFCGRASMMLICLLSSTSDNVDPGPTSMSRPLSGEVVVGSVALRHRCWFLMTTLACGGGLAVDYGHQKVFVTVSLFGSSG